jgi:prepilin peptidase CpaA
MFPFMPFAIALAAALVAAVTDLWKYRIYNILTWPLLLSGLIYQRVVAGETGLVLSVLGVCVGFVPMALLYLSGGLGAGDVKLMAGLGAWLGPVLTIQVLFASWLAAGLSAVVVLFFNWIAPRKGHGIIGLRILAPHGADGQLSELLALPNRRRRLIPFGLMILAGVVAVISTGNLY